MSRGARFGAFLVERGRSLGNVAWVVGNDSAKFVDRQGSPVFAPRTVLGATQVGQAQSAIEVGPPEHGPRPLDFCTAARWGRARLSRNDTIDPHPCWRLA